MIKGIRPDITAAQILAIVGVALALVLRELGLITTDEFFGIVASSGVLKLSDTGIRIGRNVAAAAQHKEAAAQLNAIAARPDGDDSLVPASPPPLPNIVTQQQATATQNPPTAV